MKRWLFGWVLLIGFASLHAQLGSDILIARLAVGSCKECVNFNLQEGAVISLLAVSPDGARVYVLAESLRIFDRQGRLLRTVALSAPTGCLAIGNEGTIALIGTVEPIQMPESDTTRGGLRYQPIPLVPSVSGLAIVGH